MGRGGGDAVGEEGREGSYEGEEEEEVKEEDAESEFTMAVMLKSLNIEPDVLGYDPIEDKWRD
ncbi:hypothetical protein VTH06DRAFT_2320 [Thermothelomyces fergusii]